MITFISSEKSGFTIYINGKVYNVPKEHEEYENIKNELYNSKQDSANVILNLINKKKRVIEDYTGSMFSLSNGELLYNGKLYSQENLTKLCLDAISSGIKPVFIFNFMEKLEKNPLKESKESVWRWLSNTGLAINHDGDILGFKYVKRKENGYTDCYTATMNIQLGVPVEIPRHLVCLDESECAASGLHVGNFSYVGYAKNDANKAALLVKVNPEDIVSVPKTEFCKVRCCRYTPIRELTDKEINGETYLFNENGFVLPFLTNGDSVV